MAVHALILKMNSDNVPATMELGGGKWCHTPEYVKRRYSGSQQRAAVAKQVSMSTPKLSAPILKLELVARKLTPSERMLLIAQLEKK